MGACHSLLFPLCLSLSLSLVLCFLSSAPQLCSLTGAGDWFVISNKELPTKDNGVKRTSLPQSVAQSTLPFRMKKSELLTPFFQSLSAFAIWSALSSNVCVSQSLPWHVLLLLQCAFRLLPSPVECDERWFLCTLRPSLLPHGAWRDLSAGPLLGRSKQTRVQISTETGLLFSNWHEDVVHVCHSQHF